MESTLSPKAKANVKQSRQKAAVDQVPQAAAEGIGMKCGFPRCADGCKGHTTTAPNPSIVTHVTSWAPTFPYEPGRSNGA